MYQRKSEISPQRHYRVRNEDSMNEPKITVIIPTRERCDVLGKAIKTVTNQDYRNLQIIVSDNFSSDSTSEIVRSINDSRLKYINTGKRLSMSHNWEFALSHVADGWVMVIGDDDGLLPGALSRAAKIIGDTGTSAIISNCCTFIWPTELDKGNGRLLIPMRRGLEIRDSQEWLRRVVTGRSWYSELPMLYAGGLVKMEIIKEIRSKRGSFFQSSYPDIFSAIALASTVDRYVFSHEPFAIAGHSKHSNGASWSASAKHGASAAQLESSNKFLSENNIPLHADIPFTDDGTFPVSDDLLVYESYLQAEYLHKNSIGLSHQSQLRIFLARRIVDRERMIKWAAYFAKYHDINLANVNKRIFLLRSKLKSYRLAEYISVFTTFYRIEPNFGIKISDVYEASIVADTVLRLRPGRARSWLNTIAKWMSQTHQK